MKELTQLLKKAGARLALFCKGPCKSLRLEFEGTALVVVPQHYAHHLTSVFLPWKFGLSRMLRPLTK